MELFAPRYRQGLQQRAADSSVDQQEIIIAEDWMSLTLARGGLAVVRGGFRRRGLVRAAATGVCSSQTPYHTEGSLDSVEALSMTRSWLLFQRSAIQHRPSSFEMPVRKAAHRFRETFTN